ncbi:hypothetical protein KEM55_006483, partial [Ascosphaera atra]
VRAWSSEIVDGGGGEVAPVGSKAGGELRWDGSPEVLPLTKAPAVASNVNPRVSKALMTRPRARAGTRM